MFACVSKCVFHIHENANTAEETQRKGRRGTVGQISLFKGAEDR